MTGDAVNVAARLEQHAAPGEVLLGEATHRLRTRGGRGGTGRAARAEGQGRAGRGVAARRRARGASRRSPSAGLADGGRERPLAQLQQAFEAAEGDQACQLFTVLGSAGVGKSRLVEEFCPASAAGSGAPGPVPALRRGHHVLPGGRGDQAGRGPGRLRPARRRRGEGLLGAARATSTRQLVCRHVSQLMGVAEARGGRGDVLGDPEVLRGLGARASTGAGVRRHPLGRAHVPRPRRAHRGLVARLADTAAVHGAPGPAGRPPVVGRRQAERGHRVARAAHGGTDGDADREPARLAELAARSRADRRRPPRATRCSSRRCSRC